MLVGGCPAGSDVTLPSGPLHYAELDVRGAFHHTPAEVDHALALLADGDVDWRALAGRAIGLDELARRRSCARRGEARKLVVDPRARSTLAVAIVTDSTHYLPRELVARSACTRSRSTSSSARACGARAT